MSQYFTALQGKTQPELSFTALKGKNHDDVLQHLLGKKQPN